MPQVVIFWHAGVLPISSVLKGALNLQRLKITALQTLLDLVITLCFKLSCYIPLMHIYSALCWILTKIISLKSQRYSENVYIVMKYKRTIKSQKQNILESVILITVLNLYYYSILFQSINLYKCMAHLWSCSVFANSCKYDSVWCCYK